MYVKPFNPSAGTGVEVVPGAASASTPLSATDKCVRVYNSHATNSAYIRLGYGTVVATTADLLIGPGHVIILYKNDQTGLGYLRKTADGALAISTGNDGTN